MVAPLHKVQLKLLLHTDLSWINCDLWGKVFTHRYRQLKEEVTRAYKGRNGKYSLFIDR